MCKLVRFYGAVAGTPMILGLRNVYNMQTLVYQISAQLIDPQRIISALGKRMLRFAVRIFGHLMVF